MSSLQAIGFVDSESRLLDGLVSVRQLKMAEGPHERAILLQARAFKNIDYVYFRRFKDPSGATTRSSQVAAYVIDNSRKKKLTKENLAGLHHKLWLHAVAPLIYVAWPTQVDILSCARKPDFWDGSGNIAKVEYEPAETIRVAAKISEQLAKKHHCSAHRLADGTFWDEPRNHKFAQDEASAHRCLIQAIVETDAKLDGANRPLRRRLLVLIKYLEDRSVFPAKLFGQFHAGARSVLDILSGGTVSDFKRLLSYLEKRFNGDVFALGDCEAQLTNKELKSFANLIEAITLGGKVIFGNYSILSTYPSR